MNVLLLVILSLVCYTLAGKYAMKPKLDLAPVKLQSYGTIASRSNMRSNTHELKVVAEKAAGVFRTSVTQQARPELRNVVIVTATNAAYKTHLQNFACWLNELAMKALLFSLDSEMQKYAVKMVQKDPKAPTFYSYEWATGISSTADWRTPEFHVITTAKLEVVLAMLRLQYDVLFVDPDVALMRDPFPYLLWQNVDMAYSRNALCPSSDVFDVFKAYYVDEGNTGFYFVRASNSTINLFHLAIAETVLYTEDEQTIFWRFIKNETRQHEVGAPRAVDLGYCHDFHHSGLVRSRRRPGQQNITIPYVDTKAPQFKGASSQDFLKTGLFVEYTKADHKQEVVMCPLDGCMFSAGALSSQKSLTMLKTGLNWRSESVVSMHANWMIGLKNKVAAMKQNGVWLAAHHEDESYSCSSPDGRFRAKPK